MAIFSEKYYPTERILKVYFKIIYSRKTTRRELANEFGVSPKTISRDIEILGNHVPIITKQGRGGGIYIMEGYKAGQKYLSEEQKMCIEELRKNADENNRVILDSILRDFSMSGGI